MVAMEAPITIKSIPTINARQACQRHAVDIFPRTTWTFQVAPLAGCALLNGPLSTCCCFHCDPPLTCITVELKLMSTSGICQTKRHVWYLREGKNTQFKDFPEFSPDFFCILIVRQEVFKSIYKTRIKHKSTPTINYSVCKFVELFVFEKMLFVNFRLIVKSIRKTWNGWIISLESHVSHYGFHIKVKCWGHFLVLHLVDFSKF